MASGTETSLRELAEALVTVMGRSDLTPEFGPARSVNPVPRRLADTSLAADRIGFTARTDLSEGLRQLVVWWKTQTGAVAAV